MKKTLDWNKYIQTARQVVQEGCVLLENKNDVLPLKKGTKVAVFGRIQHDYYKSGTGSGGMVNVTEVIGILDGLKKSGRLQIDAELEKDYLDWEKANPFELGVGWGKEPWCQKEMPVSESLAKETAGRNDAAIIIIGRTAGEDKDNIETEGSWFLTAEEKNMIKNVSSAFEKTIVVLNTGNIIDMNFVKEFNIKAVLYTWQGGMIGGDGVSDVLTGIVSPSGKLTDTIAEKICDYPASKNFGSLKDNVYAEDIFVGYRYFESAAKDKVLYPFGFGLSYTQFEIPATDFKFDAGSEIPHVTVKAKVKNTGKYNGKETVQLYVQCPQGKLGKPSLVLAEFKKTKLLKKGSSQNLTFDFDLSRVRSFDDTGVTGNAGCFVIEEGTYEFFIGNSIRNLTSIGSFPLDKTIVLEKVSDALKPVVDFKRLKASSFDDSSKTLTFTEETVKASAPYQNKHRDQGLANQNLLESLSKQDKEIATLVSSLTDQELSCLVRGEGMGSPKVTPGTAAAFGGVTDSLKEKGIPCGCCTDGPSGIRMDSGAQAFSLPNGTLQASTFNPELIEKLYSFTGLEMVYNKIDVLLGPGINIHRHPLNGRNFEYFSEDPYVTGIFASAIIKGLQSAGVTGSLKHFCCNNQETGRWVSNSVVSERALREIYLTGFEMAVKNDADVIMTSYGAINGMWAGGNYDLNTLILRKDWGFKGIVMTDWWAESNDEGKEPVRNNIAQNVRAQNDLYMVVPNAAENTHGDNTLSSLEDGSLKREELLRSAFNTISFLKKSHAQMRFENKDWKVKIIHRQETAMDSSAEDIVYYDVVDGLSIPLDKVDTSRGHSFSFGLVCDNSKRYRFEWFGKTGENDLAQINVSVAWNGVNVASLCWNGTHGEYVPQKMETKGSFGRYIVLNMFFAQSGLTLREFKVTELGPAEPFSF